jgi:hypothetical protein
MKHNRYLPMLGLIACAFASVLNVPECHAVLIFDVSMDTSPLINNPAGPFYIDFQLNDGSGIGDGNNTVTINNFLFPGGNPVGSPLPPIGGASGDLSSSVSITDKSFLNEFTQQFNPGSGLSFRVNLTTNVDAGSTPDAFSFAILDNTLAPLPTTGLGDAFLLVDINQTHPAIDTFRSADGSPIQLAAPQFSVISVPETGSSISMLLIGLGAIWCLRRGFPVTDHGKKKLSMLSSDAEVTALWSRLQQLKLKDLVDAYRCGNPQRKKV